MKIHLLETEIKKKLASCLVLIVATKHCKPTKKHHFRIHIANAEL